MTDRECIDDVLCRIGSRDNQLGQVEAAIRELQKFPERPVPHLVAALGHADDAVRLLALQLLEELGSEAEPALPKMISALEDKNRLVRIAAVGPVAGFGQKAHAAIPILQTWIGGDDRFSHVTAIGHILMIAPASEKHLLPVLIDAAKGSDGAIQLQAVWLLRCLGDPTEPACHVLQRLLDDESEVLR